MRTSYSQGGEDLAALLALQALKLNPSQLRYLDIGAAHPIQGNNTYLLYTMGARGVLVEPNPELTGLLRSVRAGDVVVGAAVGEVSKEAADYCLSTDPTHNSLAREGDERPRIKVPVLGIGELLAEHFPDSAPEIVSIDAEGADHFILLGWDFARWRPAVMCVELDQGEKRRWDDRLIAHMIGHDYVLRGASLYNGIFVDEVRYRHAR